MKRMTVEEALDVFSGMCMYAKSPSLDEAMNVIRKTLEHSTRSSNPAMNENCALLNRLDFVMSTPHSERLRISVIRQIVADWRKSTESLSR